MNSRYEVLLNGISLSSVHPNILVLDVNYQPPETGFSTYNVAKRNGARIHKENTSSISVGISFEIHSYSVVERQHICNMVSLWAKNGGLLEINDRPGQRMRCVCSQKPSIQSARNWTDPVTVTFTAYTLPFWEESEYAVKAFSAGTSGDGFLYVPGSVDGAMIEADILANATLSSVSLTANGRTLTLSGLSVSSGSTIKISYTDDMIQQIKVGTTSLLNKRSGADDLIAKCGELNSVSFSSNASTTVTFKARGLWT